MAYWPTQMARCFEYKTRNEIYYKESEMNGYKNEQVRKHQVGSQGVFKAQPTEYMSYHTRNKNMERTTSSKRTNYA